MPPVATRSSVPIAADDEPARATTSGTRGAASDFSRRRSTRAGNAVARPQPAPVAVVEQRQAEDDRQHVEEPVVPRRRDQHLEQHQAREPDQPDRPRAEDEERGDQLGVEHEADRQPGGTRREAGGCTSSSRSAAAGSGSGTRAPARPARPGRRWPASPRPTGTSGGRPASGPARRRTARARRGPWLSHGPQGASRIASSPASSSSESHWKPRNSCPATVERQVEQPREQTEQGPGSTPGDQQPRPGPPRPSRGHAGPGPTRRARARSAAASTASGLRRGPAWPDPGARRPAGCRASRSGRRPARPASRTPPGRRSPSPRSRAERVRAYPRPVGFCFLG